MTHEQRATVLELVESFDDVMALLRKEAPGTPMNNREHDQLGIRAYYAIDRGRALLREPTPQINRQEWQMDTLAGLPGRTPTLVEQLQAETRRQTAAIPPGKTVVTIAQVEWLGGAVPYRFRFGTAVRVGDGFELGAEALTNFTKGSTSASLHVMWSK